MRKKTCCFTGHRAIPNHLYNSTYTALKAEIIKLIETGYCYFGTGGALGFDTFAAQVVLELRQAYPNIRLILVLPCLEQTKGWAEKDIAIYEKIKNRCNIAFVKMLYCASAYGWRIESLREGIYSNFSSI